MGPLCVYSSLKYGKEKILHAAKVVVQHMVELEISDLKIGVNAFPFHNGGVQQQNHEHVLLDSDCK